MTTEIFDAAIALEQAGGSEELARELFTMLLNELPDHQQAINITFKALNTNDTMLDQLWDPVHKLHGACAYLGVPALFQAAKDFEHTIKENDWQRLASSFQQLDLEINRLLEEAEDIFRRNW